MNLSELPFWTEADDAELDVLVAELVRIYPHPQTCETCVIQGYPCEPFRKALHTALEAIIGWRNTRILQARAAYLRVREEAA